MAETGSALNAALAAARAEVKAIGKDANNEFHRYKYTSAEAIIGEMRPLMASHGLSLTQEGARMRTLEASPNFGQEVAAVVIVTVGYTLRHASGEQCDWQDEFPAIPEKGRPLDKAVGSALTQSLKYTYRGVMGLDRIDDAEIDARDDTRHPEEQAAEQRRKTRTDSLKSEARALVKRCRELEDWTADEVVTAAGGTPRRNSELQWEGFVTQLDMMKTAMELVHSTTDQLGADFVFEGGAPKTLAGWNALSKRCQDALEAG